MYFLNARHKIKRLYVLIKIINVQFFLCPFKSIIHKQLDTYVILRISNGSQNREAAIVERATNINEADEIADDDLT